MIQIDGSYGEGGGQILRTAFSLAAITGQALRIERIRANRKNPGLAIQHLTGVKAIATLCQAQLEGASVGSSTLEFIPRQLPKAGRYLFDVAKTTGTGSAGAVTLILQTILMPLALAEGESTVTLKGGTWVAWSPPFPYIQQVYLPHLQQMGVQASAELQAWGWYPKGNGEIQLNVTGTSSPLKGLELLERGQVNQVHGLAVVTELPSHIPQRMVNRAESLLRQAKLKPRMEILRGRGIAPGTGIFLGLECDRTRAGFGALGKLGLAAEQVAELATQELLKFYHTQAPVDPFLADQLLLPLALASEPSQYRVAEITQHLTTNAWVIEQFGIAQIEIDSKQHLVTVTPNFLS